MSATTPSPTHHVNVRPSGNAPQSATGEQQTTPADLDFLLLRCVGRRFAVRTSEIHEVTRVGSIISVRIARQVIEGVVNLRGCIIPVIDLAARLGDASSLALAQRRLVVIDADGDPLGLLVDEALPDLRSVSARDLAATEGLTLIGPKGQAQTAIPTWVIATFGTGDEYVQVIDTDRILSLDEQRLVAQVREAY